MLDSWLEGPEGGLLHTPIKNVDKFIVIEVKRPETNVVLFYSIDKVVDFGIIKQPQHTYHNRKRFEDQDEAVKYLKAGVECLKKKNKVN